MNVGYPTLNFGLGEDIEMLRDAVYKFAQAEIAPRAAEIDESNLFPNELWQQMGDMGSCGSSITVFAFGLGLAVANEV